MSAFTPIMDMLTDSQLTLMKGILNSAQKISGIEFDSIPKLQSWTSVTADGLIRLYDTNGSKILGSKLTAAVSQFWKAIDHHSQDEYQQGLYKSAEYWYKKFLND